MAARVLVAAQASLGTYPELPLAANSADLVETAGDAANGHYTPIVENRTYVQFHNTGAGARTASILSAPDDRNRTGDIDEYSLGAGEITKLFGPYKKQGWANVGPDRALANPSAAADDIIDTTPDHGFAINDAVKFTALTGGAGLVVGQRYFVVAASLAAKTFRVAETKGGAPIDFTTNITAGVVVKDVEENLWIDVEHAEVKIAVFTI